MAARTVVARTESARTESARTVVRGCKNPALSAGVRAAGVRAAMNRMPTQQVLVLALLIYLPMIGVNIFTRPPGTMQVGDWGRAAFGLGLSCAIGLAVVKLSRALSRRTAWGRALHAELRSVLGPLTSWQILLLSLLSGFGEEILFRGVIQPRLGLWAAALMFGALHFPYRRLLLPWSAFALGMGVVLGLLTETFASLWPAIVLHFVINYFNLHDLQQAQGAPPQDDS